MFPNRGEKEISFTMPCAYPKRHKSIYFMALSFVAIVGVGYILFRTSAVFITPELIVREPSDGAQIYADTIKISGITESKVRLTVNGYETYSDDNGLFELALPFQKGFQTIDVRVKNRIGKESRVVRHIVVE
jgi:hypothetical protein